MTLTEDQIAAGWIAHDGLMPLDRCDILFSTGEISKQCNLLLAAFAVGPEHIIAYRPEPKQEGV